MKKILAAILRWRQQRNNRLSGKYQYLWVEESFSFETRVKNQLPQIKSKSFLGSNFSFRTSRYLFSFLSLVFLLLLSRLVYLQISQGTQYSQLAKNNRERIIPIPAERGLIFDTKGSPLTSNIPSFYVTVVPQDLPREAGARSTVINQLAQMTNQKEEDIMALIKEYGQYRYESIIISEDLDYETALSILVTGEELPGVKEMRSSKRQYLDYQALAGKEKTTSSTPNSLSHLLGYTGKLSPEELSALYPQGYLPSDIIGKNGLEKSYENILRGQYGRRRIEVNALGKELSVLAEEAPLAGQHLWLSGDWEAQEKLETIILANAGQKRTAAIALNPQNGEILALVSLPAYDNNDFSGGISQIKYENYLNNPDKPLFNRVIAGTYPSGSTIKPVIAAAALNERIITAATTFLSTGGLQIGDWFFPDWQAGGHGATNVRRSLAWSVNTFFYYIGGGYNNFVGLGVDKITKYLKQFGFSSVLGLDLPGEEKGFLPSKEWKEKNRGEKWYIGDTYNLSIGQGDLLVTPLQIAAMTATFANDGILFQPHLVKQIINPANQQIINVTPNILATDLVSQESLNQVRLGMKDCVDCGSCRLLSNLAFSSAAKTGTAQWHSQKNNHAWFTVFAPYEEPRILLTVLVEEGGQGSDVTARNAYDFLKWWGNRK